MAVRSVDFLPSIFQTDANKQFLAATLDQLIQEPQFKKTQGFVGRSVGPGVNPNDGYVVEPTTTRANYQLEPSVVSLEPDTDRVRDAITYPGLNDAVGFQGGNSARPDRLYESEYYSWDPFVDFDAFVNFSQYFWVPEGPQTVSVAATGIGATQNFVVTRNASNYTFSDVVGENPTIDLIRGGSYTFQVAQNQKQTVNFRVRNNGGSNYLIDNVDNPSLTLVRGDTYVFNLSLTGAFPFYIKSAPVTGASQAYNTGVSRNGSVTGLITFVVPQDAPDTLYYIAGTQVDMQGVLNIIDGTSGTGPGFFIQSAPGITGKIPTTPNISSRDVYGVTNNGEDLGIITFNVPLKTAQSFYYNLPSFGTVDLITSLQFDQINNQPVTDFLLSQGGIDDVTNLEGRTLIFVPPSEYINEGWERTSFFDPLTQTAANNGLPGSFDSLPYDLATEIPVNQRFQVWQISYVDIAGTTYIELSLVENIDNMEKFTIQYGAVHSNTQWFKNNAGQFEQIPLLTAVQDVLYYQDAANPDLRGRIRLLDPSENTTVFVDEILGSASYTSPNGVEFTNGLKVKFTGDVVPASYKSGTSTVYYTQTEAATGYIVSADDTNELYVGQEIVFSTPSLGGLTPGVSYYVRSIAANGIKFTVSTTPGGPAVTLINGTGNAYATALANRDYYVSGVGTAINLLPVENFVTPESYVVDYNDSTVATEPADADYLTIDRASLDRNAWSRSNRWFHIDVINAAATYNNTTVTLDNEYRAKRPIIQFRPNIRLWNMGTQGKAPVDIIDFEATDAFSDIVGSTSYAVDGYTFVEGTRVIFAADEDSEVRNKIYVVSFVIPDTVTPLIPQPIINLTVAADGVDALDQSTVVLDGTTAAGKTYWYDGTEWILAQQKTSVQQAPLFNVYDPNGFSFGDSVRYTSTTFSGSKLFSYAVGDTTILDPILQFPLQYLNINNVGDIVFVNNLYQDTFLYVVDNVSVTKDISSGSVREYSTRTAYVPLLGWQTAATESKIYQQFKFEYTVSTLKLDIAVTDQALELVPVIKIYVNSEFLSPSQYSYTVDSNSTTITLANTYLTTDIVEVLALSDQTSAVAFYQVPINLESNPLNANSQSFTLGTIRTHYQSICENLLNISGSISGANNTRDLGNIVPYGLVILQQSAPLTLAGYFMRSQEYNIFAALQYSSREYTKYKALLLDNVESQQINFQTPAEILDSAIDGITQGRIESQPFYWSDMLPSGIITHSNNYTVGFVTGTTFDTVQVYNFTSANYLGLLVYLNDEILTRDVDYTVATDGPRITILTALANGDVVTINEYITTAGSFVPNTPSKMGLYPAWKPELTTQRTSAGLINVIVGHDGSTTPAFGDIRDDVLLEFETRIYNNLKLDDNPVPLAIYDVLPGQFRETGFSFQELTNIFSTDFLSYCAWNKLDYGAQTYNANNPFTYNYSTAKNRLNNQPLLGGWRGIYRYFYDTEQPSLTPWEMLGLSVKPSWWEDQYGPAPYTSDNLVLWDDIAAGRVADPAGSYIRPEFARPASFEIINNESVPSLLPVIPTGSEGELLPPLDSVTGQYDPTQWQRSWALGDGGPVEASWYNSSSYPFAVMRALAVTRPAKFFALFADRDLYRYNTTYEQYLYNNRYRLDANGIEIYGNGVSKASYINWIVDFNRQSGLDSTEDLAADLRSIDVRLAYRMASFSDKQYIKLYTEKSSPSSTNTALLIPDESYNLLLYKNQPFDSVRYSAVAIQKTSSGYAVFGYGNSQPYFNILQSRAVGRLLTLSAAGITVRVPTTYTDTVVQVPYGFVFSSATSVCDFLLSYGKLLESQGLTFTNLANGYVLDWPRMATEFLYWAGQGWSNDAIINLNPLAAGLTITRLQSVVDSIKAETTENLLLDQNSNEISSRNLNVVRMGNTFSVQPLNNQAISFIDLRFTSYEHVVVINNQSVFGDLIYDPVTGARQSRLQLAAVTSDGWNGSVNAPGFILNQDNIEEWTGLRTYAKGEIVEYKNVYWSALTIVQPSATFNFNDWAQSDYNQIQLGLLPNLANKANQLANSYDINSANIESDNDLLSYGLIGFRPRQYMAALNIDDVSQVNIYRQFLGTKGTVLATELFKQANFDKETAQYDIYENWAVQQAVYGANANRSYVELRLNRALLDANPSLVQVVLPQQVSEADQQILLSNVWRQSYKLTSPDFLPTTLELPTDTALPTAGYVNLDDVDITVFDINDPASLAANIDAIQVGTSIWVAKINSYDWNIYRAESVPGVITHVCDNLNGTSRVIFSANHGLAAEDKLIIKFFDIEVNGVYQVLSVSSLTTVNIAFRFTGSRVVANGSGLGFTLRTMRVSQASDVVNLPYANAILPGAKVWVDNNGQGQWEVWQKNAVFTDVIELAPLLLDAGEQYGQSIAQAQNRLAAFVGSPRYGFGTGTEQGAVYVYVKDASDQYTPVSPLGDEEDGILTLDAVGVVHYGASVDFGNQSWAVAGAPDSTTQNATCVTNASGTGTTVTLTFPTTTAAPFTAGDTIVVEGITPTVYNGTFTVVSCNTTTVTYSHSALAAYQRGGTIVQTSNYDSPGYACVIYRDPVLGQPGIIPFAQWQMLTPPTTAPYASPGNQEFGTSVALSLDERWMYIGSPGTNQVHVYGQAGWQDQYVRARADGVTTTYQIGDDIQIDAATQLRVSVDGVVQTLNTDYVVATDFGSVTFLSAPGLTTATALVAGTEYTILSLGNTNWAAVGYYEGTPVVGGTFLATGSGSGTGTAFANYLIDIARYNAVQLDADTYYQVTQSSSTGGGTGAEFTIRRVRGDVGQSSPRLATTGSVGFTFGGSGYAVNDNITISATSFDGGVNGVNDLVVRVSAVDGSGAITALLEDATFPTYTAPAVTTTFSLNEYFFTATTIDTFSVTVEGVLQRPNLDYTFNTGTRDLRFENTPNYGSVIIVTAQDHWLYSGSITVAGLGASDRFGQAVSCTTDGRQVMIGAPDRTQDSKTEAGTVYVFDRNVQRFIYGQDTSTVDFTLLGTPVAPISVIVNNVFLTNDADGVVGAANTFHWDGANTVTVNADLVIGDVVEIETNQFALLQTVTQNTVAEFSNFGSAVDICAYNCSLYIGEPQSSTQVFKGGIVERFVNQSRIYGTTTSGVANPALTATHTLRVNNQDVPVPAAWNSAGTYNKNTVVYNTSGSSTTIYRSIQAVPALTAITNTSYWQTVTTTTVTASVPVRALAAQINVDVPNATATVDNTGVLTVAVKNSDAAAEYNKVQVAPGSVGTAFAALDFDTFVWTQNIESPYPVEYAAFGTSVSIDDSATNLVVGAPNGTLYLETEFDDGTTFFDSGSTIFFSLVVNSGAAYTFDYLPSATMVVTNPGKFVFGQQIVDSNIESLDAFGTVVNYTGGVLMVGAPNNDFGDSTAAFGRAFVFENANRNPSWSVINEQQPRVDIRLLNGVFLYDSVTSARSEFLDFIDPLQGKILGAARQNIDYIGAVDPASYNVGPVNVRGTTWSGLYVGQVWWDTSTVRFIDPNQDDIVYAARRWSQIFPGSTVDVYQWIESPTPPAQYTGEGEVRDSLSYSINSYLTEQGTIATDYYFWVRGITQTATKLGKTLPVSVVASYIENAKASGIPYLAPINGSTVALYNSGDYIEASDTVINIEFDREYTTDNVHVEYQLIPQDRADGFLNDQLYRKLQDSFCGADTFGNLVPDPNLSIAERYGVQFRPRQSMFVDRFAALRNYLTRANSVLKLYPISETSSFNLLNSADPEPSASTGLWNLRVANLEILGFQNINAVPMGYRYLVATDSLNRGLWTIYQVQASDIDLGARRLVLVRVQLFNTPDYWSYIDWYRPGYNSSTKIVAEVAAYSSLTTLSVPVGSSVKVTANAQNKWEIYLLEDTGYNRVGLQDGTIEFSAELYDYALGRFGFDVEVFDAQYFDQEPVTETRKIIQAINQELFVDDLAIERNRALMLMFNYVLSEFSAPEWLVKTSLIDVDHTIRELVPFQNFIRDNQEFVVDYIQEVKPYHVQVREFNLRYTGFDDFRGDTTDFDLPAFYDTSLQVPQYVSPILLPYFHSDSFNAAFNTKSDTPDTSTVWQTWPYTQWYNNHLLNIDNIVVIDGGTGYTEPPQIELQGDADVAATAVALVNAAGVVTAINITDQGSGYGSTPTVAIISGNGTGARAYAQMTNDVVRQFRTTIRFDRYQYRATLSEWDPDRTYQNGELVRYDNRVWQATSDDSTAVVGPTFDLVNWTEVNAGTYNGTGLSGVDRIVGLYVAGVNQPGLELPLLIDGVDYPGVQVYGNYFLGDPAVIDATYSSQFTDTALGTLPTDINVDGGAFIGPYEAHAPEELVNGAEFDTLDMRVYTRPGSDWSYDGHGFSISSVRYTYTAAITAYSWDDTQSHPVKVLVFNMTTGLQLNETLDYSVDYVAQSVEFLSNVSEGDAVAIYVYELGGGNQLYRDNYNGDIGQYIIIPVNNAEINDVAVFVNGEITTGVSWVPYIDSVAWSILNSYPRLTVVNNAGLFYRAIQAVPIATNLTNTAYWLQFVPTLETKVNLGTAYTASDDIALVALALTTVDATRINYGRYYTIATSGTTPWTVAGAANSSVGTVFTCGVLPDNPTSAYNWDDIAGNGTATTDYSWSTPVTETFVADSGIATTKVLTLDGDTYIGGTNAANLVVTRNGLRLRPPEGIEWFGDGSSQSFGLPQRGGYEQSIINAPTDIQVWVDDELQVQSVGAVVGDYAVTNWPGSNDPGRQVLFAYVPQPGARILVSVSTVADYSVVNNTIEITGIVNTGDVFGVTTWNDTAQQAPLTLVFQGPVTTGATVYQAYDSTDYDSPDVGDPTEIQPGEFDFTSGITVSANDFNLERENLEAGRLWVTLDGQRLFAGRDYTVDGYYLVLASGAIGAAEVLAVTEFTDSVVPEAMAFRIFQDMRGVQAVYRITDTTSTTLVQDLSASATVAYVDDASKLSEPNLSAGIFGVVSVEGERIMYRERDTAQNTISGLRRGTAGTAAAAHSTGDSVLDFGRGNLLPQQYQDYVDSDTSLGDGTTTVFYAPNILFEDFLDSSSERPAIEVYVGGVRQYAYSDTTATSQYRWFVTDFDPLAVDFVVDDTVVPPLTAPASGVEVTILVRRGVTWYAPGNGTASDGVALQDTETVPARFFRGL